MNEVEKRVEPGYAQERRRMEWIQVLELGVSGEEHRVVARSGKLPAVRARFISMP